MAHIHVTPEAGQEFYQKFHDKGPIVMLNLLRFREVADYTEHPELAPDQAISGAEAYQQYAKFTLPLLAKAGSKVLFNGKSGSFVIGPTDEKWDAVLLVEHASLERFIAFAQDEAYLNTMGHRTAALADSRLLPITATSTI